MKPRRRRLLIGWLAGVALLGGALAVTLAVRNAGGDGSAANAKKKKDQKEAPPAPVELSAVRRGSIATYLQTTAALEARNSAVLVARREGQVVTLLAEEGQWVDTGQPLARLDDTEARLAVERAEVAAQVTKSEAERGRQLKEQGFLSAKEWDDLDLKLRNAQVELGQARYDLAQTWIVAPFSGRVVERTVNLGEMVTPGKACFRMVDFDPVLARVYFPERELTRVRVGQPATLTLDSHPGEGFAARVALVNPVVDRGNGTFKVTLELPNPSGKLRPGAFARVRLMTGRFDDAMLLPRRGVLDEDGEHYVFVARGDSVVRAEVTLGAVEDDTAQILAGLAAGDRVVTVGQGGLKPGAKIKAVSF